MARTEEVELTNMCMVCDGEGNVLVQNKENCTTWRGWTFPGGHVEKGEYVTPSVVREIQEETGLTIEHPRLCGIKEFHCKGNKHRYIVFLYIADHFSGTLKPSGEGNVFWYPLAQLAASPHLIDGFHDMLPIFMESNLSEIYYSQDDASFQTVYC